MKRLTLMVSAFLLLWHSGCSSKNITVNGIICPAGHSEEMIQNDFRECRYYDMKAIEKSSRPKIDEECLRCLEDKGYILE
ncbi:MAG: hypothetical protein DSZ03_06180 [Sulfurimonas sp.]|nr:MAG: hypothetical protein DSZ03_06180 [Sulfurimonas sp.]